MAYFLFGGVAVEFDWLSIHQILQQNEVEAGTSAKPAVYWLDVGANSDAQGGLSSPGQCKWMSPTSRQYQRPNEWNSTTEKGGRSSVQ